MKIYAYILIYTVVYAGGEAEGSFLSSCPVSVGRFEKRMRTNSGPEECAWVCR